MARYIDVDKLIAEYDRVHIGVAGGARKLMVEAPTADVVEVVRCKDCKNRNSFFCPIEKESGTAHWFEDEDYCSFGERKENK